MRYQSTNRSYRDSEQGAFLVIIGGTFLAILAIVGLAVDAGHIYLTQLRVQRAVDAAAIGGAEKFRNPGNTAEVETIAAALALNNLVQNNVAFGATPPTATAVPGTGNNPNTVTVNGNGDSPLLIFNYIPWISQAANVVGAAAVAINAKLAVALVLDRSGSMSFCMSTDTWPPGGGCGSLSPPSQQRIEPLRDAAKAFLGLFNFADGDRVAVVTYNDVLDNTDSSYLLNPITSDFAGLDSTIDAITASGSTNIQAGLQEGRNQLNNAAVSGHRKVLILFSDGAPNKSEPNDTEWATPICAGGDNSHWSSPSNDWAGNLNDYWDEVDYMRAVWEANLARSQGMSVYGIGLGQSPPPCTTGCPDPFQVRTSSAVKPILMKAIANAATGLGDPAFPCMQDHATYNDGAANKAKGTYAQTQDANQLVPIFLTLGQSLKTRLTQ